VTASVAGQFSVILIPLLVSGKPGSQMNKQQQCTSQVQIAAVLLLLMYLGSGYIYSPQSYASGE